jgi:hypothetical protein
MGGERRRRQVLHRQVRKLVYKVFSYFKREADTGMPVHDVAKPQDRTDVACDIIIGIVPKITSEGCEAYHSPHECLELHLHTPVNTVSWKTIKQR